MAGGWKLRVKIAAAALAAGLAQPAAAGEGMWLPMQAEALGAELKAAGLALDPAALADLSAAPMNAIVSLGGCSASFVSPKGLVATNHHCVYGSIQYNSTPEADYLTQGFRAKDLADERPAAPGTRVYVIEALTDVTKGMNRGVTARLTGQARAERLEANRRRLIAACEKTPNRRCDVRAYFGGESYYLQRQLEIKDVRLVYAPAGAIGNYGGEIDNWRWPRHTGDFGFYRAYVAPDGSSAPYAKENVPYAPKSHLRLAADGLKDGDFVMLAGFPGVTERHRTAAEAEAYYARIYPLQQKLLAERSDLILAETANDPAAAIKYASILQGVDNYKKKILGQMEGAAAISLVAKKQAKEAPFLAWAAGGETPAQRNAQAAVAALAPIAAEDAEARVTGLTMDLLNNAQLLGAARTLYRFARERAKPDLDRDAGFQDRDRRALEEVFTRIERRFDPRIDRAMLESALKRYRALPEGDRSAAFEAGLAEIGLDRLYAETSLDETGERLAWLDRPASAFEASADPFIRLAVAMAADDQKAEDKRKDRAGRLQAARAAYMTALRTHAASLGRPLYPDANGSLRFTFGKVEGRAADGMRWDAFTTGAGIAAKATGVEPFNAPPALLEKLKSPEAAALPVNALTTLDITNGNSGSAVLNGRGELVGLAFDGTIEGVISDWWVEDALTRAIIVDARYMRFVMEEIDGAGALVKEMTGE